MCVCVCYKEGERESDRDPETDGALAGLNKQAWRMRPNV